MLVQELRILPVQQTSERTSEQHICWSKYAALILKQSVLVPFVYDFVCQGISTP